MPQKIKTVHALNWLYGNICTKKCYSDTKKQRRCYETMKKIIEGNENFMITHKLFIQVMRRKHNVCDVSDEQFYKRERDFWTRKL